MKLYNILISIAILSLLSLAVGSCSPCGRPLRLENNQCKAFRGENADRPALAELEQTKKETTPNG